MTEPVIRPEPQLTPRIRPPGLGGPPDRIQGGRPYRTAFETRLDYKGAVEVVREELREWLRLKHFDVDAFDDSLTDLGGAEIRRLSTDNLARWQVREPKGATTWVTTISVTHDGRNPRDEWLAISVEAVAPAGTPTPAAKRPLLMRGLLERTQGYDGPALLRWTPTMVATSAQVRELLAAVLAEGRRLPLVVAAAPHDDSADEWRERMASENGALRFLPGLASMYLLDRGAWAEFNDGMGPGHRVGAGCVRTYLANVDISSVDDATRHRMLSRHRLEAEPHRAEELLVAVPQQRAARSIPPSVRASLDFTSLDFALSQRQAPDIDDELIRLRAANAELEALLGIADSDVQALTQRARDLELERDLGRVELDEVAFELTIRTDELERSAARIRALQQRLDEAGRHDDAWSQPAEEVRPLPLSFDELLERLAELEPYVYFTGDRDVTRALDTEYASQAGPWAQTAWRALLAMADYARTKASSSGYPGDLKTWCERPAAGGRVIEPKKVARDESESLKNSRRLWTQRTLPVPVEVHPNGEIFMGAHVTIGTTAQVSPRMYFHDGTSTRAPAVYVGYLGRHLRNTMTT